VYSGFNDYSETDLVRLKKSLLDIKHTADKHGAATSSVACHPVFVVLKEIGG
jgi:hypothetical protein